MIKKKAYAGSTLGLFIKDISSFVYEIYRHRTSLFNNMREIKKNKCIDPILRYRKYKAGDKYCFLCIEENQLQLSTIIL